MEDLWERGLAEASQGWAVVNLSFVIDARDFFHDFRPETLHCSANPHWENFTNLCLTSDVLRGHEGWELLDTAARAAMKMPKLKRQTLWTGGSATAVYSSTSPTPRPGNARCV
ncbi:hypothetical protein PG999_009838 [Apiospora kogelbergensis]|uniref:DUF6546 domain-containing protein n=1 Tax=Apiospora kogelbergensis TaxID=1337665 RepID=A0AAW0QLS8_9PEZI